MKLQILRNLGDGYPPLKEGEVAEVEDNIGEQILAAKRPLAIRLDEPAPEIKAVEPPIATEVAAPVAQKPTSKKSK